MSEKDECSKKGDAAKYVQLVRFQVKVPLDYPEPYTMGSLLLKIKEELRFRLGIESEFMGKNIPVPNGKKENENLRCFVGTRMFLLEKEINSWLGVVLEGKEPRVFGVEEKNTYVTVFERRDYEDPKREAK